MDLKLNEGEKLQRKEKKGQNQRTLFLLFEDHL